MSHDYACPIDSRRFRIDQLAHRICHARDRAEALAWQREIRKAAAQLLERVAEHVETVSAREKAGG